MVLAGKVNEGISELLSAKWADYNTQLYHQMFLKHKQLDLRVTEDRLWSRLIHWLCKHST